MVKLRLFLEKNPQISGLFVSLDGQWFNEKIKGYDYMSREEILGEKTPEKSQEEQTEKEVKPKKKK